MANQTLKNAHGGYGGRTLINRLEQQMDKRRKKLQELRVEQGIATEPHSEHSYEYALWHQALNLGRQQGIAASIAIMRSSSVEHEMERSNERLGIE